jgi:hypothetical protein
VFRSGPGYLSVNGGTVEVPHPWSASECTDIIKDFGGVHPLEIFHDVWDQVGTITTTDPSTFAQLKNYPFENQAIFPGHNIDPVVPSDTEVITKTMARTNPSRPEVSIPQFLAELRDIPAMLHLKGRKTIDGLPGSSAVEQNFGWNPLIDDLKKMSAFTAHVANRRAELYNLHASKGLSRGMTAFSETVKNNEPPTTFNSAWGHPVGGFVSYTGFVKKWGSVHWIPSLPSQRGAFGALPENENIKLTVEQTSRLNSYTQDARFLVHGWDSSAAAIASTLWELIPWSWLADYFFNVGDYLAANRNGANAVAELGCVMTHHRTVAQQVVTSSWPWFTTVAGRHRIDQKYRVLATAGITATVPFISIGQLVTMSSLAQSLAKG